jgi:uncharacterized protein YaaQ
MKLIITIVDDRDVDTVMTALTSQRIGVTCVSSTGGLLMPGQSTLLIGVEEHQVKQSMNVIANVAAPRRSFVPYTTVGSPDIIGGFTEVPAGGYLTFVLDTDHFEQV